MTHGRMTTRNIQDFSKQCESDRIREQLALDPQSVAILNDYTAWYVTVVEHGGRNVADFLDGMGLP